MDQAIGYWGSAIEAAMDEVDEENPKVAKSKRQNILHRFLDPDAEEKPVKGQFLDPATMF